MVSRATFEAASSRLTLRQVAHHRSQGRSQLIGPRQRVLFHIPHHLENVKCLAPAQGTATDMTERTAPVVSYRPCT